MNDMAKKQLPTNDGLFTQQDQTNLRRHRKILNDWIQKCDRAEACGVDVGELRRIRDETDQALANVEHHFMGGVTGQM